MNSAFLRALCFVWPALSIALFAADTPPFEWIDRDTGHRVIRLSREPGTGSLYFHQNAFAAEGDKMVMVAPSGIVTFNWTTRDLELVVPIERSTNAAYGIVVGRKSRQVFFVRRQGADTVAYATHLDTRATREIGKIPGRGGSLMALNADETQLAGSCVDADASQSPVLQAAAGESKGAWMQRRFEAKIPMRLFTIDVRSGKANLFHPSTDWLNHVQMSPTDPGLMLFCHEGPWHLVNRTWIIRTEGSGLRQIHPRTMEMEIAGHEFFSWDGKTVWYDLQTPRGQVFWLAGYEIETGKRTWYSLQRDEWSVHFNISPDGTLFAGDGGGPGMVARARDGQWIYLFKPGPPPYASTGPPPEVPGLIKPGVLRSERLVNMANHDYSLEPNVNFTPDGKWIVFRSNMFGPAHVFAVEVAKAAP